MDISTPAQIATAKPLALSDDDIRAIVRHPDPAKRAIAAQRICREVRSAALTDLDRRRAHKILAHIANDVAAMVRRALAVTLRNSPELPRDLAVKLIADIDTIAVPLLEGSPVLTDEDLLAVLRSRAAAKVQAIARRTTLTGDIVKAVIRFGDGKAIAQVAANDHAVMDQDCYDSLLDLAGSDDLIEESLISRRDLPPAIVEKLITQVSADVAIKLTARHSVAVETALSLAEHTRERASIDFIDQSWVATDLRALTQGLHEQGRLTESLIIRAAGCGQMRFTEHALAVRAGVSAAKAGLMMHESSAFGLAALTKRGDLSPKALPVLRGAIAIFRDLERGGIDYDRAYFQQLMIQRVLSLPCSFTEDDGEYLLEKLDGLTDYSF